MARSPFTRRLFAVSTSALAVGALIFTLVAPAQADQVTERTALSAETTATLAVEEAAAEKEAPPAPDPAPEPAPVEAPAPPAQPEPAPVTPVPAAPEPEPQPAAPAPVVTDDAQDDTDTESQSDSPAAQTTAPPENDTAPSENSSRDDTPPDDTEAAPDTTDGDEANYGQGMRSLSSGDFSTLGDIGIMANPVSIPVPAILAQMANHSGWTGQNGSSSNVNNCIRYGNNAVSGGTINTGGSASNNGTGAYSGSWGQNYRNGNTAWLGSAATVWSAHGRGSFNCPTTGQVSLGSQSALGFNPSGLTSIQTGTVFNLGRMVHKNNPVQVSSTWFRGDMNIRFMGQDMTFKWRLWETDNIHSPSTNPLNNDLLDFLNQTTTQTFTHNGLTYTLVVHGFTTTNLSQSRCTDTLSGSVVPINQFSTVEGEATFACLWASVEQVRPVTVKKVVASPYVTAPAQNFDFTSTSSLSGTPWAAPGSASLAHNQSFTRTYNSGEAITITEAAQTSPWEFTSVACVDGQNNPVDGVVYDDRTVTIPRGTATDTAAAVAITCTYTNTYAPKATITLKKDVISTGQPAPVALPAHWTLTAQGQGNVSSQVVTGPGNSADVTSKQVIAGNYQLSELANTAATTGGYVQDGNWTCTDGVTVGANGQITLTHGKNTTCTVKNRFEVGELKIAKAFDASVPAATTDIYFTGTYTCDMNGTTVASGTWSVLGDGQATLTPVGDTIPVGAECSVAENDPPQSTGLPAGYEWGAPSVSAAVVIATNTAQTVTVTNTAEQLLGDVLWTKIDEHGEFLGGAEWTLQGPGDTGPTLALDDCVEPSDEFCLGPDTDARAGHFSIDDLEWGTYTLTETRAPAGFILSSGTYTFTISGSSLSGALSGTDGNAIVNTPRDGLVIPLTGGLMSRDFYQGLGMSILVLGAGAVATALILRNRRKEVA